MSKRVVILGAGESGTGAALLAKVKSFDVFVSDQGLIKEKYKSDLIANKIEFEEDNHSESKILVADLIIKSPGIPDKAEIVKKAKAKGIEIIDELEFAFRYLKGKVIAITGTNGKTTTTSMVAAVLSTAGLDPTMVIGGRVHMLGTNAKTGEGEFLVAEADESDGSFLLLSPTIAVVTNIDKEHMDFHQTMERLNDNFLTFINKVPFYGLAVLCIDDVNVRALLPKAKKRFATYGLSPEADFSAEDLKMTAAGVEFTAMHEAKSLGKLRLHLPGRHSATNALAAVAVAHELEIPFTQVSDALSRFTGIHRRFEIKGEPNGILVIDDYGHHPTEIRATIGAIRDSWKRPLTVIFQPHRFTRTRDLFDEFLTAFEGADRLVLTEIYPAGEDPIPGMTGEALYQAIKRKGHLDVQFVPDKNDIVAQVAGELKQGDISLTLGAGDIYRVGEALVEKLK